MQVSEARLAQATGFYRKRPVSPALADHFVCAWVHRLPDGAISPIVVVPDGCIDLQWVDGALRIAGPDRDPQTEMLGAGATIIGFRFRPAVAAAWLGVPASEIVNSRVPLEDIWGAKGRRLAETVSETHELAALVGALENALARHRPPVFPDDADMPAAFAFLKEGTPSGRPLIRWLAEELALSERTLRRRFDAAFGYGPKTLDRILRFQRFLRLMRNSRNAPAASLAAQAGYADQAHLIRESRRLAASTPREIAALFAE